MTLPIFLLFLLAGGVSSYTPQPSFITGWATHYDHGVMQATVEARQGFGQLPDPLVSDYAGFVARPDCSEVGSTLWLRPSDASKAFYPFLVADCAGKDAFTDGVDWMTAGGFLVEVDYHTAVKWDTLGRGIQIDCLGCNE